MKLMRRLAATVLFFLSMTASVSHAGGIILYELGTDNTGLVNAGVAARAQGPSTIASNPAGLSYLSGTQITAAAQLLFGDIKFNENINTNTSGESNGSILNPIPSAAFFMSKQIDDHWDVGLGSYSDFGLAVDYNNNWAGRYFVQRDSVASLSMVPSVSYRVNDQWTMGVGVKAMYGMAKSQTAIDMTPLNHLDRNDAEAKYKDTAWGYGGNIGTIYQPTFDTRIGLAYTSKVDLNFEDRLDINGGGVLLSSLDGAKTKLDMSVPQTVTLSLYQKLNDRWALLASTNWQDWSQFGEFHVDVDTNGLNANSSNVNTHCKDTWHVSLGAQYQATEKTLWNAGVAYDTSMVSDKERSFAMPMQSAWRLGTGATHTINKTVEINISWDVMWMDDMSVDQTKSLSGSRVSGNFDNAWIQSFGSSATWRF